MSMRDDVHRSGELHRLRRLCPGLPVGAIEPDYRLTADKKFWIDVNRKRAAETPIPHRAPAAAARRRRAPARTRTMTSDL
jgi:hypothetical protein